MAKPDKNWHKIRGLLMKRDGGRCRRCGEPAEEIHHIVKRREPRPSARYDLDNMIAVCKPCHRILQAQRDRHDTA